MKHINATVKGRVQGVFFRASTRDMATRLGITGYVCNRRDGSVYVEAEGDERSLAEFSSWLQRGPVHARVQEVILEEAPAEGYRTFEIRR